MKRILIAALLSVLALLGACSGSDKEEIKGTVKQNEEATEKAKDSSEENTKEAGTDEEKVAVDSQVVVDNENVKISLISIKKKKDSTYGDEVDIKFDVENKTDQTITVQAREVSADGRMIDESAVSVMMSTDISSGKTGTATLTLWDVENAGDVIPEFSESLELILNVFYAENYEDVGNYNVNVQF